MKVKWILEAGNYCQGCFGSVPSTWRMVPAQIFRGSRFEHFCNECRASHDEAEARLSEVVPGSCFEVEAEPALPLTTESNNPFHYDMWNMGTPMGKNLMIMHSHHASEVCESIILVNLETGERVRIHMRKFANETA
ncbi:MAG: hypothetical protein JHC33_03210 [Ignisphaera sp.]|nr:hypothetical protein [Ignisphaera sp.]